MLCYFYSPWHGTGCRRKEEVRDIGRLVNTMHLGTWEPPLSTEHLTPTTQLCREQLSGVHMRCWQFTQSSRMRNWLILQRYPVHSNFSIQSLYVLEAYGYGIMAIYRSIIFLCCGCRFLPPNLDPNLHNYISVIIQAFPRLQIIINLNPHYMLWRY